MSHYKKNFKNGYLQIDFLFVVLSFLVLFSFTYLQYIDRSNDYEKYLDEKKQRQQLSFVCDLLVSSQGDPKNWNDGVLSDVIFYGLKSNISSLDQNKINLYFNQSNYLEILESYSFNDIFYAQLKNSSGDVIKELGEAPLDKSQSIYEFCFAQNASKLLILEVGLWN